MNRITSTRTSVWTLAVVVTLCCKSIYAADPALVGVLADAVKPEIVEQLKLSDDQLTRLKTLIEQRERVAEDLLSRAGDGDPGEIAKQLAPFIRESELQGMRLLSTVQRDRLRQLAMARRGMESLGDEELAVVLNLSKEQQQQIDELLKKRTANLLAAEGAARKLTHKIYERRLADLLTEEQQQQWRKLAGLTTPVSAPATQVAASQQPPMAEAPAPPVDDNQDDATKAEDAKGNEIAEATKQDDASADNASADDAKPTETEKVADASQDDPPAQDNSAAKQPTGDASPSAAAIAANPQAGGPREGAELVFNFYQQPWKDVMEWFADEADLSLQMDDPPQGTFSYRDSKSYTPVQALDLINSVLLRKGYTMVQHGRMLFVLNREGEIPPELVPLVDVADLDDLGTFSQVKVLYQLTKMSTEDAETELTPLLGPGQSLRVLPRSRQVLVTETVGKQRVIRDTIEAIENPNSHLDKKIVELKLKHALAEDLLSIARPLLGLPDGENTNEQINIAVDPFGTRVFATGTDEAVARLREILPLVDIAPESTNADETVLADPEIRTYSIRAADPENAYQVLATLLAGLPDVRMSLDRTNNRLIVMGRPTDHELVGETLMKLEGEAKRFEVITLTRVDPQLVVLTVTKMFGLGEEGAEGPSIDAEPGSMKLFVRGTPSEIAQVREVIEELEASDEILGTGNIRMIPLSGADARSALERMKQIWPTMSVVPIKEVNSSAVSSSLVRERATVEPAPTPPAPMPRSQGARPPLRPRPMAEDKPTESAPEDDATCYQQDAAPAGQTSPDDPQPVTQEGLSPSDQEPIVVSLTPNGLVIACNDIETLNKFEQALRKVSTPQDGLLGAAETEIVVFYLKYAKADAAAQLLVDILGGGSGGGGGGLGDITNLLGGGIGGMMGALMGGGGGGGDDSAVLQTASGVSIVPDARLNRLVVQGTPEQTQIVDQLLKIIDKESSITEIETEGRLHLIPVVYTSADTVAKLVKEAFPNEVGTATAQGGGGGGNRQPDPAEFIRALRGGGRRGGGGGGDTKSQPPKMTISVHEPTNSLVVVAPDPLFRKVEMLVETLDQAGTELNQTIDVVNISKANPELVSNALSSLLGGETSSAGDSARSSGGSTSTSSGGDDRSSAEAIQRRIEFFNRLRSGGFGGGGRPGGGSTPSFGGGRGGGGPPGGFGGGRGGPTGGRGGRGGGR